MTYSLPPIRLPPGDNLRLGADVGGTKVEVIALGSKDEELLRRRAPTPAGNYSSIVRAIADLILSAEEELGVIGSVGVGHPGALSPATGLIKNSNSVALNGMPLHEDLEEALDRPVRMANDADCLALSEAADGAAAGEPVVFGVILGTGVGGGLVVDGSLVRGPNAISGEWGHNPLPAVGAEELPGLDCYCGRRRCVETYLSGPALAAAAGLPKAEMVVERADEGDRRARAALDSYAERLARALAVVVNIVDPNVIVLAGGLSNLEFLYEAVPARWGPYIFSDSVATRLVKALHGDSSGGRGAARLWP